MRLADTLAPETESDVCGLHVTGASVPREPCAHHAWRRLREVAQPHGPRRRARVVQQVRLHWGARRHRRHVRTAAATARGSGSNSAWIHDTPVTRSVSIRLIRLSPPHVTDVRSDGLARLVSMIHYGLVGGTASACLVSWVLKWGGQRSCAPQASLEPTVRPPAGTCHSK